METMPLQTDWNDSRPQQAYELALLGGLSFEDMARCMCISLETFNSWRRRFPVFENAIIEGGMRATARVALALYKRATGYEYDEEVVHVSKTGITKMIVHRIVQPDVAAAAKWLSAKHRSQWSEVSRSEITQTNININKLDLSSLSAEELSLVKSINLKQAITRGNHDN
jgi:hypothetical protein